MYSKELYEAVNPVGKFQGCMPEKTTACGCVGCVEYRFFNRIPQPTAEEAGVKKENWESYEKSLMGELRRIAFDSRTDSAVTAFEAVPVETKITEVEEKMSMIRGIDWESAEEIVSTTSRALLFGPPGTGKTTCGILMAKRQKKSVYSVTLHSDITAQELIGHFIPKGGEFVFHHGPFIRAWKEGAILIINEICEAGGPVLTALYSILDDPSIAMLTLPNGETVRPAEGFKAIATMNGTLDSIPEPLLDRFEVKIYMGVPHPDAIRKLPKKYHEFIKRSYASGNKTGVTMRSAYALDLLISNGISDSMAFDAVYGDKARDVMTQFATIHGEARGE